MYAKPTALVQAGQGAGDEVSRIGMGRVVVEVDPSHRSCGLSLIIFPGRAIVSDTLTGFRAAPALTARRVVPELGPTLG